MFGFTELAVSLILFPLGAPELIIIVVGIALLFGGRKIPELMKGLGTGIKEFKQASSVDEKSDNKDKN